jgi:hypothetical protein
VHEHDFPGCRSDAGCVGRLADDDGGEAVKRREGGLQVWRELARARDEAVGGGLEVCRRIRVVREEFGVGGDEEDGRGDGAPARPDGVFDLRGEAVDSLMRVTSAAGRVCVWAAVVRARRVSARRDRMGAG